MDDQHVFKLPNHKCDPLVNCESYTGAKDSTVSIYQVFDIYIKLLHVLIIACATTDSRNPASPQILLCDIQINILMTIHIFPTAQNLSGLYSDPSRLLKVTSNGAVGFHIYDFLVVLNGNIWLNSTPLQDTSLQTLE